MSSYSWPRGLSTDGLRVLAWNERYPIGARVRVSLRSGASVLSRTESAAFLSPSGRAVIFLWGMSGWRSLLRVSPEEDPR